MRLGAGEFNALLILQACSESDAGRGQVVDVWTETGTVWAKVKSVTGKETFAAMQTQARITHEVIIRNDAGMTVDETCRFQWGVRLLYVQAVLDDDGDRSLYRRVLCEERKPESGGV